MSQKNLNAKIQETELQIIIPLTKLGLFQNAITPRNLNNRSFIILNLKLCQTHRTEWQCEAPDVCDTSVSDTVEDASLIEDCKEWFRKSKGIKLNCADWWF
jgi:hypothetical protein